MDQAYCGSFPTLPCRADLFTGKPGFYERYGFTRMGGMGLVI